MSQASLSDDILLALVHEIRAQLRRAMPSAAVGQLNLAAVDPVAAACVENMADAHKDLELLLGRVSDFASAHYLSKARPLPLAVAIQCAALHFPAQHIEIDFEDSGPPSREVPVEMVRSLSELLDNAIKFSRGAPVTISVRSDDRQACTVIVSDRGVGLSEEQCERVFDFLARLHSRDDFPGFGLGLPIARRICEAAGATLHLATNAAGGVSAVVRLPRE